MNESNILKVQVSRLEGEVSLSGAKNSALRLMAATILTEEAVELYNFPNGLLDVKIHAEMLETLGKKCVAVENTVKITEPFQKLDTVLNWEKRSIRNTLLILGALTTRFGEGRVPLPGGCKLGERKYELHVMLLERLGAEVWEEEGFLCAKASKGRLKGDDIHLPIRSTGATENAILCGSLAQGKTTIWNPHVRPEIMDLVNMLSKMGSKIKVFGQKCIEVEGVDRLHGVNHSVIPDNMEALTWAIGSVITGGDIEIHNFPQAHLDVPLIFLKESGMKIYHNDTNVIVRGGSPYPLEISTGPYPGINSDMQPLIAVYAAMSQGVSKIIDLRFPGRYGYAKELAKMGMNYQEDGDLLVIYGGNQLSGAKVNALDLRAGMALLLAGLTAEGETHIENAWQIGRGYEDFINKLRNLGADLTLV